jgi:hypothetical protein
VCPPVKLERTRFIKKDLIERTRIRQVCQHIQYIKKCQQSFKMKKFIIKPEGLIQKTTKIPKTPENSPQISKTPEIFLKLLKNINIPEILIQKLQN